MQSHWLHAALIYLAAAVVFVPLAKRFGLGSIIGYLGAGVAIGPYGLGVVKDPEAILHAAEFGVVLMMFLIGLELEPPRLWALRRPIFGWGSAQLLGCAAVLGGVGWALGAPWSMAVIAGLGLALSSTAVSLQIMQERHLLPTAGGQAGFAILLLQDVAAIPILALIPLLGQGTAGAAHPGWQALKAVAVIAAIILGGRLLLRHALRWVARSRSPEIFTAAALGLVVGIASLMEAVGLSMALGAFLGGVLLAESEYKRELETDVEPFKGLLLGLFFMAVGMSMDFAALWADRWLVLGLLGGFLALKAAVIWALATAVKVPLAERPVLTLLLAQGGEFAFEIGRAHV
jgi:glutathione-regulated potassium-efflux system ancillary protein KefC